MATLFIIKKKKFCFVVQEYIWKQIGATIRIKVYLYEVAFNVVTFVTFKMSFPTLPRDLVYLVCGQEILRWEPIDFRLTMCVQIEIELRPSHQRELSWSSASELKGIARSAMFIPYKFMTMLGTLSQPIFT